MFSASYWDPFSTLGTFGLREGARLRRIEAAESRSRRSAPHYETRATEHEYVFSFDVPGLSETDLELEVHEQTLTVRAERKSEAPEGFSAHRIERPSFRLAQTFTLPTRVDVEKVHAALTDGILTITLPKAAEAKARRIEITTARPETEVQS